MDTQTVTMQMLGMPDKSQQDGANLQFAHLVVWLKQNTTERERDLIYLVENFNRAWLTKNVNNHMGGPDKYSSNQLKKVEAILEKFELSHLLEVKEEDRPKRNGWDVT